YDAVVAEVVLGFDVDRKKIWFDDAIRVEDMHSQFLRSMRAHTVEVRGEIGAFVLELVAWGAVLREKLRAVSGIPRLDNLGPEPGNQFILLLLLRTAQLVDDCRCSLRHRGVPVRAQAE